MPLIKPVADRSKPDDLLTSNSRPSKFGSTIVMRRYRDTPPDQTALIAHKSMIANDAADSLHIFTFESPADCRDVNWAKFGTPILEKIAVIPTLPASLP